MTYEEYLLLNSALNNWDNPYWLGWNNPNIDSLCQELEDKAWYATII